VAKKLVGTARCAVRERLSTLAHIFNWCRPYPHSRTPQRGVPTIWIAHAESQISISHILDIHSKHAAQMPLLSTLIRGRLVKNFKPDTGILLLAIDDRL